MDANQQKNPKKVAVGRIVVNAIRKYQGKTGVSLPELKKVLKDKKKLDLTQHGAEIKLALKNAVDRGILRREGGSYMAKETKGRKSRLNSKGKSKVQRRKSRSKSTPNPVKDAKAVPSPGVDAKAVANLEEDAKVEPADPRVVGENNSKGKSKVQLRKSRSKSTPNPVEDAKAVPSPGDDAKVVPNLEEDAKVEPADPRAVGENDSKGKSKVQRRKSRSKPTPNPVEDAVAVPSPREDAKAVSNLEEDAKVEPTDPRAVEENDSKGKSKVQRRSKRVKKSRSKSTPNLEEDAKIESADPRAVGENDPEDVVNKAPVEE